MITKPVLTLADVDAILAAARAEAVRNRWEVTIAVVDDGGFLQGLARMDGASKFSSQMAEHKARTAALSRRETKGFEELIAGGRLAFLTAPGLKAMLEGGVPVLHEGHLVGAVGVSGVKSHEDAQVARAGIAALG
jgi:uncharacterized protein GlcG (DUF336 family)